MRTHPSCEFFVFDGEVYYNNIGLVSGAINQGGATPVSAGCVSLYEINVDRLSGSTDRFIGGSALLETAPSTYDLTTGWVSYPAGDDGQTEGHSYDRHATLQGWWRMDAEMTYAGGATDESGNGRDGEFTGGSLRVPAFSVATATDTNNPPGYPCEDEGYSGIIQTGSAYFDGNAAYSDYIEIGTAATWDAIIGNNTDGGSTEQMSFSLWMYMDDDQENSYPRLFQFGDNGNADGQVWAYVSNTRRIHFSAGFSTTRGEWNTETSAVNTDQWHHIAITYAPTGSGGSFNRPSIYVNGELIALSGETAPAGTYEGITDDDCFIGDRDALDRPWTGYMADFAVWNSILEADEVEALYNAKYGAFKAAGQYIPSTIVDNNYIYPWNVKDGSNLTFRTLGTTPTSPASAVTGAYETDYSYGDILSSSYPMSASIVREFMFGANTFSNARGAGELMTSDITYLPESETAISYYDGDSTLETCATKLGGHYVDGTMEPWLYDSDGRSLGPSTNNGQTAISCNKAWYPHYWAVKSTLDSYGYMSEHYKVTASLSQLDPSTLDGARIHYKVVKDQQIINFISIPSIFYGSQIKPGSVSLKWYYTGSLAGELQDTKQNGELIQVSGNSAGYHNSTGNGVDGTGSVAGVVLYNEGFVLLTGSWALNDKTDLPLINGSTTDYAPSWRFFGAGANDGVTQGTTGTDYNKASFVLSFKGTSEVQTMTMFANAKRGEANYSNNPTFINFSSSLSASTWGAADPNIWVTTSSFAFEENTERTIFNFASSSSPDYSASFKRQVYISRVGIYDDNKNLIGVATLANPVRKEEDQDITFKIKLDI